MLEADKICSVHKDIPELLAFLENREYMLGTG